MLNWTPEAIGTFLGAVLASIAATWAAMRGSGNKKKSAAEPSVPSLPMAPSRYELAARIDDLEEEQDELRKDCNGIAQRLARIEGRLSL